MAIESTGVHEAPGASTARNMHSPELAREIAREAYVYLFPLVLMDLTRKQMINREPAALGGPANSFTHIRAFPPADIRMVVRPNFDTLYSTAWVDLTQGPVVLSTEDTHDRYFMLPMLDMWTDVFAVPGKRASGTEAQAYVLTPAGWTGDLPAGVQRIEAPTPYVWLIGRTQTNGANDYDAVHEIQDGYRLTLLADWGKAPRRIEQRIDPGVDTKTEPSRQVAAMSAPDFFAYGAELMMLHPPHLSDWSMVSRMRRIVLEPGRRFDPRKAGADALAAGAVAGLKLIRDTAPALGRRANGWMMNTDTMGVYGNYYLKRAAVALVGLGANQPEDAVYPFNVADSEGKPVMGQNRYVLHFDKDRLPPVAAFWSLTMYDAEGYQVANPLNRFAIGDRDELDFNPDGSLDLYVQHESPGRDYEANWLPAPAAGELSMTLRLYAPAPEVANGKWNPPPVKRVG